MKFIELPIRKAKKLEWSGENEYMCSADIEFTGNDSKPDFERIISYVTLYEAMKGLGV